MLRKLGSIQRQMGAREGSLYLLARVLDGASGGRAGLYRYHLFWQPVPREPLLPSGKGARIAVRPVASEDATLERMPRPREVLRRRVESGDRCLGAFLGGELVGFLWYAEDRYREDEARCTYRLPPGGAAVWDYDVYIDPRRRLSPVFARLWDEAAARFRAAGVQGTFSRISAFNTPSLASQYRLGGRKWGTVTFLRVGNWQLAVSSLAPRLHLSRRAEPVFQMEMPDTGAPTPCAEDQGRGGTAPPAADQRE
ncbi:MAG: N-acetyltransferase family protein [Thiohalorhabdus sp.]|uniref:GNAT family N-acetyltransferase n=1 Tax=Thiohalorhabdus sp. TaxID=3094134 RepID=UPI0039818E65